MNTSHPLISVIIPVYNSEKYLESCINSVLNQTYFNLEIILVNDGSTDSSANICDAFAQKDSRIKVIHKQNGGQADARNKALDIAQGEYIGFVDSDDTVAPEMYEKLYSAINEYDCTVAMCGRYNVDETSKQLTAIFSCEYVRKWKNNEAIKRFLIWDGIDGSPCDKLFSRSVIANLRFPLGLICEDIPFVYNVLKNTKEIIHIGTPMYNYLQRSGSSSHSNITDKTLGMVEYPAQIRKDVIKRLPHLQKYADYFYFSRELIFIQQLLYEGYYNLLKERMKNICNYCRIIVNPLFSFRQKLYIFLIITHSYTTIYKCYKFLKGKKQ
ncbi:MAG: glycosyltransferase [Clostridia bacterium]|nr:glycosyltransferase [Clostridia bacterium]